MTKPKSTKRGPGHSVLAPHEAIIQYLLAEKGMTYKEVEKHLESKFGVACKSNTIWHFVDVRRRGYQPPKYNFPASTTNATNGTKPLTQPATDSFALAAEKMARSQAERERKLHTHIDPDNLVPRRPSV